MGLSFHYNGAISDPTKLHDLIEEVTEIAKIYDWEYSIFETAFPNNRLTDEGVYTDEVFGLSIMPPDCEPVFLSFLSNGRMSSPIHLKLWGKTEEQEEQPYLYMLATKTHFSSPLIHATIIHLLRHISSKYLTNFNLIDEGEYWETNDEAILKENFKKYTSLLDNLILGLKAVPIKPDENFEQYLLRLSELISNLKER